MRCTEARSLLNAYIDSELDAVTSAEIMRHLESCEACNRRFAAELALESEIGATVRREEMPEESWSRIERQMLAMVERRSARRWIAPSLVALVAIAVIGALVMRGKSSSAEEWLRLAAAVHRQYESGDTAMYEPAMTPAQAEALIATCLSVHLTLPRSGVFGGHDLRFVGARTVDLGSGSAVQLLYVCCDHPVSAIVVSDSAMPKTVPVARAPIGDGLDEASVKLDALRVVVLVRNHSAESVTSLFHV